MTSTPPTRRSTPPRFDAAPIDAAPVDAAPIDAAPVDAMPIDAMPIDAMPDAPTCPTSPCDLVEQCGCQAMQACDLNFSTLDGQTACRPAGGGDANDTCASTNACAAGYVCVGGTDSSCKEYCADDADCPSPRAKCAIQLIDGNDDPIPGATVCSSNCNPTQVPSPDCPTNWTCDLFSANNEDIVDCRPNGTATQDQSCATADCAAGHTCVNFGAAGLFCQKICAIQGDCPTGSTCTQFSTPFNVGGQNYGVCI